MEFMQCNSAMVGDVLGTAWDCRGWLGMLRDCIGDHIGLYRMTKSYMGSLPICPDAEMIVGEAMGVKARSIVQIFKSARFLDMIKKFADLTGAGGSPRTAEDCRRLLARRRAPLQDACTRRPRMAGL